MKYTTTIHDTDIELRLLEAEESIESLTSIVSTMADMLGRLNEIANHYVDTVTKTVMALPSQAQNILSPRTVNDPSAGCSNPEECASCPCTPTGS